MKKLIFLFIFIFSFFGYLLFSRSAYAQTNCGDAYAEGEAKRCCNIDLNNVDTGAFMTTEQDNTGTDRWGCVDMWLVKFCTSDFIKSGKQSVINVLNKDNTLDELKKMGVCQTGKPSKLDFSASDCVCEVAQPIGGLSAQLCNAYILGNQTKQSGKDLINNKEYTSCVDCFSAQGFWTAMGCFYFSDWKTFVERNIFGVLIGLAGIISLLCIIYSAFVLQTSRGNPEKIKNAQERLTSCVLGLLLIIFSIFILRLIGVSILGLPGLK